ncbi:hypothetical protein WN55_09308 [Dufourea novaeangliae]|uniref:Uncharacterized protein n=1 Tax=Dufourea novaeangliae TaxID=178035 RepID=A0A154PAK9_DUFNO|nr:hypothetical protein WN55_09308 [Dufourea novaeangliae]
MLKASICSGAWILTILLLVTSVSRITRHNVINGINDFSWQYHHDCCCRHHHEQLKNSNYHIISSKHIQQDFKHSLNDTCPCDSLSIIALYETINNSNNTINFTKRVEILYKESLRNNLDYSINSSILSSFINYFDDIYNSKEKLFIAFNNISAQSIKVHGKNQRGPVDYPWKRRSLCALSDDGQYSIDSVWNTDDSDGVGVKEHERKTKTLSDYNGPVFMNDIVDPDSLKTHVRVKRSKSNPNSPVAYQQDYLKDLADSFPRDSYELIDENYDDDTSFDAKREVNPRKYLASVDHPIEPTKRDVVNNNFGSYHSSPGDEFAENNLPSERQSFSSEEVVSVPTETGKEKFVEKTPRSVDQVGNQESLTGDVPVVNQRSQDLNLETVPEDRMLAVELVRKKRNNYVNAQNERNSREDNSLKINEVALADSTGEIQKLFKDQNLESRSREPSSLAIADLKADLLRFKRRAKNDRREKESKGKKKKKHASKKQHDLKDNPPRSRKNVPSRNTNQRRSVRKRKNSEPRSDGKSNLGFAKLVSKRNNDNNFRRRSVSLIKPTDKESESERASSPDTLSVQARLKKIRENDIDTENSEISLVSHRGDGFEASQKLDENSNTLMDDEERVGTKNRNPISMADETKVRSKRDRSMESRHGFLSEDDELRYYENIREYQPNRDCATQGENSASNEAEADRAVRSIGEVKDLVKELATKVGSEKRIETRAIDELCSNITTACVDFKEPSAIVQRCAPTSTEKIVVNRKAGKRKINERKHVKGKNDNLTVKKRSSREHGTKEPSSMPKTIRRETEKSQRKWGTWTDWSSCSVTCGKGRQIRWRYCLHDCSTAETEMEEKACQLPACPPGKFLGIF